VRRPIRELWPAALLALGVLVMLVLVPMWQTAAENNRAVREARADPHHIAGGLYFVGSPDRTSFLLTGPAGAVLIAGGAESRKVIDNIEQLGFDIKDVRILLASDPHADEARWLFDLQRATEAELWASDANADVLARGGRDDPSVVYTPHKLLAWIGIGYLHYDAPRVDHRVKDGETIRLAPLAVTAHITPGHAPGCTTWTFKVRERDASNPLAGLRDLDVVHRCSLALPFGLDRAGLDGNPRIRADFQRSFRTLRALPVDIWLTWRGIEYGRYRKYDASLQAKDPVAPFIDPEGYLASIDDAEARLRELVESGD
jgi:metallo-beta-lactamase class B